MRRKTILNCLSSFKELGKPEALQILITLNLDPLLRPDKLTISDYIALVSKVSELQTFLIKL